MKFLLELVPCCGSSTAARRKVPGAPPPPRPEELEDDDDVTSLVPPPQRRTKRVRTAAAARSRSRSRFLSAEWSPSLGVISEDRAVTTTTKGLATGKRNVATAELAGSIRDGTGRRTSGGGWGAPDRDRRTRDRDDYERSTLPTTMIPAFSPTPFLF